MNEAICEVLEHWKLIKILGRGGFGQVTLWHDPFTGRKIALKKLLESALKDLTLREKLTERWCKEVEIMKKLNHPNIVATLEIPSELNITDPLPVLAMEYCSNGDLRQVLNKPENCCGMREPEILNILRDISNGLAYLHSCKIIHRDIKPDNVVLQEKGSNIIYKLIDLGYAKALDQSSLSKSFVGTVQYIAPELFMGKAYTSSVDYWSFGLMTHEIITGYRPFLPGFHPSDWMKQIQNKTRNIISVLENSSGQIVFSTKISRKNHMSRCFLEDIENWLYLALDWDGQARGRDLEKNRLVIFENLTEIICKKIINVFSLPTYEILSYEINSDTDIINLREWLKSDTDLEKDDQILLLPSGKSLSKEGNLHKTLAMEKQKGSGVSLFLCNSGSIHMRVCGVKAPDFVDEIRETSNNFLPYRQLKRYCADSVYFAQTQANLYRSLLQGIKVKISNTKQTTLAVESLYQDLEDEYNQIEYYGHFLSFSLKIDLENYIYYRKAGKLSSSSFVRKWIQNAVDINNKITALKKLFNKTKQRQLMLLARQLCRNLDDSNNEVAQRTPLDSLVEKGHKLWENLKKSSNTDTKALISVSSIDELINKVVEDSNKLLNSSILSTLLVKISKADENLAKFLSQLTNIYKSTNVLKRIIENTQAERQKEVWSLIDISKLGEFDRAESPENGKKIETGPLRFTTPTVSTRYSSENFLFKESSINEINDSCSVIEDNNHLRHRIQEVKQNCGKMLKEITSLNWDSILDSETNDFKM